MGFFSKMLSTINARNRFRNAGNMKRRIMPSMFGRMGGGIGSMFPRLRPPTIEEAKGRNMANVGLLPDYMQPGGSGIPPMEVGAPVDPVAEPANRSAIMPRGPVMNRPRPPIGMAPFQQGRMAMGFENGGEAKKYPNAGLAALAKERPDVVKKILGREKGGIMDIQNFPRRSPEMLIDQLNDIIDTDSKYAESFILPDTIFRDYEYENRRKDDPFFVDIYGRPQRESDRPGGTPFFVTNPFSATILKIIETIKGVDLRNDPIGIDKVNFLRRRLIDNIKQIEDQGGTVDPDVKAQAMFVERRFKERNMPLTD